MSWLYSIKESVSALYKSKFSSLLSILSIAFSLFFLGIFFVVIFHGWQLALDLKNQIEMEVFLKDSVNENIINTIKTKLQQQREIKEIGYISKQQALNDFQKEFGADVIDILGKNPLPPSFRIQLNPEFHDQSRVKELQQRISSWNGVDEVTYRYDLLRLVERYLRIAIIIAFILGGILIIASVLLISNTIRLSILVKWESIKIMNLIGATPAFIRRPFVIEGALQGAIGAGFAIAGIFILSLITQFFFPGVSINVQWVNWGILAWGVFLGAVGSWIAIRRYLRL